MTDSPEIQIEDRAQLTVVWSNIHPPLFPTEPRPCIMMDESFAEIIHEGRTTRRGVPALTIWDWNTVPDSLSVGLVVTALEQLDVATPQDLAVLDPVPTYQELVELLGENSFVSEEWPEEPDWDALDAVAELPSEATPEL